ncbi:MAG: glycosyltransferase involved in cell wall biosynthesis [Gammaproteobacteria bacterium]|jgi:glycosyltransferase involved in cell wall biosynthesis
MVIDYSIIIPAYNEEALLANTLEILQKAMSEIPLNGEIIVTDNNSTDRTADIAKAAGVKVAFEPINQISRARNTGAKHAEGRYLIFIDADTLGPPELLQTALNNLQSAKCCGGGANVSMDTELDFAARTALAYWNTISRVFHLAAGCFVYSRRDDFDACGGFSEKHYASEEIWFSIALKRIGKKSNRQFCIINKPEVTTSSRKLLWFSHTQQLALLTFLALFPFMMRYKWACGYWYKRPGEESNQ